MKTIQLLKRLEKYPLFTENDVSKIINKSSKYVRTYLYRMNIQGLIKRIEKGKYTLYDDAMIFASYITVPSYLSLWTALRYYNMTQQQPTDIFVMSKTSRKSIQYQSTKIIFINTKHMFGYKKERYSDFDIFIAEREKAIIDSLLFRIPLNDVNEALNHEEINIHKLAKYAKQTKNKSLVKRLGYLLEHKKGNTFGLKAIDNNYVKLDYLSKNKGKKDKKWKLLVNAEL